MADVIEKDLDKIQDVENKVDVLSEVNANGDPIPEGSTLFTKREWTMRYAAPFKALMFMAAPMVIIMIVNSLYGIIDKQLALNFAIENVTGWIKDGTITGHLYNIDINSGTDMAYQKEFAQILINASTQYSNTVITLLEAMSLLTSVGTAIKWGQAMGERNKQRMDSIVTMGLIQSLIMSGIGMLIIHFVGPYIIISQADSSYSERDQSLIFMLSNSYTQMFTYGFPLLVFATFISTLIRTEGKVWWVIFINVSAIILNIACGEALMESAGPTEKMQSAVYGSFIAWSWMIVSGLLIIGFSKNTLLKPDFKNVRLKMKDAGIIWLYGISPFVSNFIFAVANYVTTLLITIAHTSYPKETSIGVTWGTDQFTISQSLQTLSSSFPWMNILYAPLLGMMQGANANYAYCKGAGKRFRLIQIWRIHLMIDMIWGLCVLVIIAAAGGPMMKAFDGPASQRWWFFAYVCGIMFGGMTYAAISLFQGIGDSFNATLVATLRSLVCNVGFIVIGWAIIRVASDNGSKDWILFMMNGLCEIPAVIVAMLIVWKYFNKLIKEYKVNDVPDNFAAPSLLTAARNEVTIWYDSLSSRARKAYFKKLDNLKKENKLTKKAKAKLDKELDDRLDTLYYKARFKDAKAVEKYRFRNQSLGNGTGDIAEKQLQEWKEAMDYSLLTSESLDYEQDCADIEKVYKAKLADLEKSKAKKLAYLNQIETGKKALNPFTLLFVGQEPQPLNRKNKVMAAEQAAKAKKKK